MAVCTDNCGRTNFLILFLRVKKRAAILRQQPFVTFRRKLCELCEKKTPAQLITTLGIQAIHCPRKRYRLADMRPASDPRYRTFETEPEPRVRERAVLPQLQIPLVRL